MKRVVVLLVSVGLFLSGCNILNPKDENDHQVVVFFNTKSLSSSLLKSTASEAEKTVEKIIIYGVDDNDVVEKLLVEQNPPDGGILLTVSRSIKTFYAIANPSAAMEAYDPLSVAALTNMIAYFETAQQSPFLMSGKAGINGFKVNIELERVVVKIDIFGMNGFEIQSIEVKNTPDRVFVFDRGGALPTSGLRTDYLPTTSTTLYVAEYHSSDPTTFLVSGEFEDKQASYNLVIRSAGSAISLLRNTHYQVNISPITEDEFEFELIIPDWKDGQPLDDHFIPDDLFE